MSAITGTRIDQVLQDAVESGAVPNVVAMAANEDGPIYEGAAGPRAVGEPEPVTPDTMFRIASMTKMVATTAALQLVERGKLDLDAPVENYRPEFADLQVLDGFDGDTPRLRAPASKATVRQLVTHTSGLAYWFFNDDIVRWEALTGTPNVLSGDDGDLHRAAGRRPRHALRVRHQHRLARPVVEATSGESLDAYLAEHILGPLGMEHTTFADERRAARELGAGPPARRGRRWAATDRRLVAGAGVVGRRPRPVLDPARLPALPADAARRRHARRGADPRARDRRRRVHEPDRRARLPAGDQDRRPRLDRRLQRRPGPEVGPRAAAQHRAAARDARGRQRRVGGHLQHPLLGRPETGHHGRDLRADAAVRGAARSSRSTPTSSRRSTPRSDARRPRWPVDRQPRRARLTRA